MGFLDTVAPVTSASTKTPPESAGFLDKVAPVNQIAPPKLDTGAIPSVSPSLFGKTNFALSTPATSGVTPFIKPAPVPVIPIPKVQPIAPKASPIPAPTNPLFKNQTSTPAVPDSTTPNITPLSVIKSGVNYEKNFLAGPANTTGGTVRNTLIDLLTGVKSKEDVLQSMGQGSLRGFAAIASALTQKPFTPQGQFQQDLYGTDKPISLTSFGRETRLADPTKPSTGFFSSKIDPAIGAIAGIADAIPGGEDVSSLLGLTRNTRRAIAETDDVAKIAKLLQEEIPNLKPENAEVFANIFKHIDSEKDVDTAINRINYEVNQPKTPTEPIEKIGQSQPAKGATEPFAPKPGGFLDKVAPKLSVEPPAPASGLAVAESSAKYGGNTQLPVFKGFTDVTTNILDKLQGRSAVSKQFISDLTNGGDLKQSERDIVRDTLAGYPDNSQIPVQEFADKVKAELLPLTRDTVPTDFQKYERVNLPDGSRGAVKHYDEHLYNSPIETSAGNVHFRGSSDKNNYFGHTRTENLPDNKTRRVIEVQSDLYQKGNLERETKMRVARANEDIPYNLSKETPSEVEVKFKVAEDKAQKEVNQLQQYTNPTAHFRMVREELKQAAIDGKTAVQFPTGETAMKIEGLGDNRQWAFLPGKLIDGIKSLTPSDLKAGMEIGYGNTGNWGERGNQFIVTDVLGDGKFKAVPKELANSSGDIEQFIKDLPNKPEYIRNHQESFDISGKVDTNNPIYKFYEKDLGRYLTSKFGAKIITDKQGVSWYEVPVKKEAATKGVSAFGEKKPGYKSVSEIKEAVPYQKFDNYNRTTDTSALKLKFRQRGHLKFPNLRITSPGDVAFAFDFLRNNVAESFYVVGLKDDKPISVELISIGTINSSLVDPYAVSPLLRAKGADGVYLVHNHPSGDVRASQQDIDAQYRLTESLKDFNIGIKGQVIIDTDKYGFITPTGDAKVIPLPDDEIVRDGKAPIFEKYQAWQDKNVGPEIVEPGDAVNLMKGLTVDWKNNSVAFLLNTQLHVNSTIVLPNSLARDNIEKLALKLITSAQDSVSTSIVLGNLPISQFDFKKLSDILSHKHNITLQDAVIMDGDKYKSVQAGGPVKGVDTTSKIQEEEQKKTLFSQQPETPGEQPERMRNRDVESANRQFIKSEAKAAEADLPRQEIMDVRKKELAAKQLYTDKAAAEEAFSNAATQMELATPGDRLFTGLGADKEIKSIPSTFPKWVPADLRSKQLFAQALARTQSLGELHYPDRINSGRVARLVDAIFDHIDSELGVDTKAARRGIVDLYTSPAVRSAAEDAIATEKAGQREATRTEKLQTAEDKKQSKAEALDKKNEELIKEQADEEEYKKTLQAKIDQAHIDAQKSRTFRQKLNDALYPVRGLDAETKDLTTAWMEKKMAASGLAQEVYEHYKTAGPQNFQEILDFQAGKPTPYIREAFDNLGTEFHRRGLDFPWQDNYVPQVWKNDDTFRIAVTNTLKQRGMTEAEIAAYLAGSPLPENKIIRLKINPSFIKAKFWKNYAEGMAHGLRPKFHTPAELIAYYREQGELTLANRDYINKLKEAGKLLPKSDAPTSWEGIPSTFSKEELVGAPELARMINGILRDEAKLSLGQSFFKGLSKTSRVMFDAVTLSGIPSTTVNSFAIGQAVKSLTTAAGDLSKLDFKSALTDLKASYAFIRANSTKKSAQFFAENTEYIRKMAEHGISIGDRYPGSYKTMSRTITDNFEKPEADATKGAIFKNKASNLWKGTKYILDKAFAEKTIHSLIPQMQVQVFKDSYLRFLQKGMADGDAQKLAAETTKKFYGILGDVGRGANTTDVLSAAFVAPYFREGVLTTLWNAVKSGTTEFKNPAFGRSRALLIGMIATFAAYTALNKKLNGKWIWQNPSGHEFDLRVPLKDGTVVYVPFMPSFLAIARNLASGGINLFEGNYSTATQKLGSVLSSPIELSTELLANKDYYGNQIYADSDSGADKTKKLAQFAGLSVTHPYIMESANFAEGKEPLYQALSKAFELPFKYTTFSKEQVNQYYDALDQKAKDRAAAKKKVQPLYDRLQDMKANGQTKEANTIYNALPKDQKAIYDQIKASAKAKDTSARKANMQAVYDTNQILISNGQSHEATAIYLALSDEDRHAYDLIKKAAQKN